jgi:hypothetical protein
MLSKELLSSVSQPPELDQVLWTIGDVDKSNYGKSQSDEFGSVPMECFGKPTIVEFLEAPKFPPTM